MHFVGLIVLIIFGFNRSAEGQYELSTDRTGSSHPPADACRIGDLSFKNGWVQSTNTPYKMLSGDDYVNSLTSIIYKCNDNHLLDGPVTNTCFKEKWVSAVPECKPYCTPKNISSASTTFTSCFHNDVKIQCSEPAPPGTIANINCREMYERDSEKDVQVTSCGDDGIWTPLPEACSISCGIVTQNITKTPWNVKVVHIPTKLYVLGTIISVRLVLSVADHFWNRTEQRTNDLSEYYVNIVRENMIYQQPQLERIVYSPNHQKIMRYPDSGNIVVLVLRTIIEFKSVVAPICLDLNADGITHNYFEGLTPEKENIQLQLPINCYSELNSSIKPLVAIDVLCTNRMYQSSPEEITMGSGFAVPIENNGSKVFYLLGVRTWSDILEDQGVFFNFQNIFFYKDFISSEINYQSGKHFEMVNTTISLLVDYTVYCRADNIPHRGNAYYESNDEKIEFGEKIQDLTGIVYRCIENHLLFGNSTNFCLDGKWMVREPECKPRCNPKEIQGWTLVANCHKNNTLRQTSCNELVEPGTVASINCQRGYERFGSHQQTATCRLDGRWSILPEKCVPVCGEISQGGAYIVGGPTSDISNVPWHAGTFDMVYRKHRVNYGSEQICGGSIITAKVIVSAIHCFWDLLNGTIHNKEEYDVAVGKSQRKFDETETFKPQFFKIENIFYEEAYNDYFGYYANDIAIVVLDKFIEFKSYIAPVCIQFGLEYDDKIVQAGLIGTVVGWGLEETGGQASSVLKKIELPVVSRKECTENSITEFRSFITSDKFCAGYLTAGIGVCRGDSGGGLVIPQSSGIKTVFFLRGIVSTGSNKESSCDNDRYATFTNVAYYADLLKKYYLEYQPPL